jgi:hypothetical protein
MPLSPTLTLIFALGGAGAMPAAPQAVTPDPAAAAATAGPTSADQTCRSLHPRDIVVCGQRPQGYRLDRAVTDANRQAEHDKRSTSGAPPPAQSACAQQPMGCPGGLGSLDLANVALVLGTAGVRAARGQDWARAFKTGPDEYRLYQQAKRRADADDAARAAARLRSEARDAERKTANPGPE